MPVAKGVEESVGLQSEQHGLLCGRSSRGDGDAFLLTPFRKLDLIVVKSLICRGVGVIGLVLPLIVLDISRVAFLLSSIMSKMDMTSVKRMCSDADQDFLGFRYKYIRLASHFRGKPGLDALDSGFMGRFSPSWAAAGRFES